MPSWYRINAAASGPAVVYLYGRVGQDWWGEGNSALDFAKELDALGSRDIELRINSEGGDVFEGYAIYSSISRYPGKVTAYIDGLAASAASYIALAADEVVMGEPAFMMIHNAWASAVGDAKDLRKAAETLEALDEQILSIYDKHSTKDAEEIAAAVEAVTWLSAEECVEWGFADRIEEGLKAAACVSREFAKQFDDLPAAVAVGDGAPTIEETDPAETDAHGQEPGAEAGAQERPAAVVRAYEFGVVTFTANKEA